MAQDFQENKMNRKALLSTAYFPPVEWFASLVCFGAVIEGEEHFQKQSFRNRCKILTSQGMLNLVVPVIHDGGKSIRDIRINHAEPWINRHSRSIVTAYKNAPYFDYYWFEIEKILEFEHVFLFNLNEAIYKLLCIFFQLNQPATTHCWDKYPEGFLDFRNAIHPKKSSICNFLGYTHVFSGFSDEINGLSSIDLLFNLGPEAGQYLRKICGTIKNVQPENSVR